MSNVSALQNLEVDNKAHASVLAIGTIWDRNRAGLLGYCFLLKWQKLGAEVSNVSALQNLEVDGKAHCFCPSNWYNLGLKQSRTSGILFLAQMAKARCRRVECLGFTKSGSGQ